MNLEGICLNIQKNFLYNKLLGARVDKVFQPEKSSLVLQLRMAKENVFLYIATANTAPHIRLLEKNTINPEIPSAFCMLMRKQLENGRITDITQENLDRVIVFDIDTIGMANSIVTKKLIVELTGKNSNIILTHEGIIVDCIKHVGISVNKLRQMLPQRPYLPPPLQNGLNVLTEESKKICHEINALPSPLTAAIVKATLGVGPFTAKEIAFRSGLPFNIQADKLDKHDLDELSSAMDSILQPIKEKQAQTYVALDETNKLIALTPYLQEHLDNTINKEFGDINKALDFALNLERILPPEGAQLARFVKNESLRIQKKILVLEEEYKNAVNADYFKNIADNLMAQLHLLEKGMTSFFCLDFMTGEELSIELQENLTPIENAQHYYKLYNKAKRAVGWLQLQIKESRDLLTYLESIEFSLQNVQTKEELSEIKNELKVIGLLYEKNKKMPKIQQSTPGKIDLASGAHIFIGKNNKQNDMLTFKIAKANDIWLHTKDIPGSHVILQTPNKTFTNEELLQAANIAAWFSKSRGSSNIPVDYTFKKHVKKPAGSKPGFVIYENQKTLYVTPEENSIKNLLEQK